MAMHQAEVSDILKALQQVGIMTHHELQTLADLLPVPVTSDVRTVKLTIKHRLGGVRRGSRRTRTPVTIFRNMEVHVHSSMILSGIRKFTGVRRIRLLGRALSTKPSECPRQRTHNRLPSWGRCHLLMSLRESGNPSET